MMTQMEEDGNDDLDDDYKGTSLLVSLPPQASPRAAPSSTKLGSVDDVGYGSESLQEALRTEVRIWSIYFTYAFAGGIAKMDR